MPATTKLTYLPNGLAQFTFAAIGSTAGALTCTGIKLATDRILHVRFDTLNATTGCVTGSADGTSETSITADDEVTTTTTNTTGKNVLVTVARAQS